jgi:macrolide transport system ATP-binding/permease protein
VSEPRVEDRPDPDPVPNPVPVPVPVLQLDAVGRSFGSGASVTHALRSVSLTIQPGEFVAIVGPSGAGKSTLLNILGLLDVATAGTHLLNGVDVRTLTERDRNALRSEVIGFVFQDSHVLLDQTAAGNTALGLTIQGAPAAERRSAVTTALDELGLRHRANEVSLNLSGGERQRVALARAMATRPTLLLADEPTGALDSVNSQRIIDHLTALNATGVTVLVITHDPTVAAAADRRLHLVDGNLTDDRPAPASPSPAPVPRPRRSRGRGPGLAVVGRRLVDEVVDAVSSHSGRPGRTALLLLAFLLGTGGLVCSLGISQSASTQVSARLTAASLDEVIVRTSSVEAADEGFYDRSSASRAIPEIEALEGVDLVGSVARIPAGEAGLTLLPALDGRQTVFNGEIRVADSGYLEAQRASTVPGSAASLLDNTWGGAVAVVGDDAARSLGLTAPGPGSVIWMNGSPIDVVGTIDDTGRDPLLSGTVVLSRAAARSIRLEDPHLVVRTLPGYPAPLADAIPLAAAPADPSSVQTETVADLRSLQKGVASDLGTLIALVSWVLLALASLSAATAMYLSVQARASEIALRRAIGASRSSIWRIFTLEGLIVGAAGGVAGGATGLCGTLIVCAAQGWTPTLDIRIVVVGLVAGCVTGVLSATYPALVAARADPASAIRG